MNTLCSELDGYSLPSNSCRLFLQPSTVARPTAACDAFQVTAKLAPRPASPLLRRFSWHLLLADSPAKPSRIVLSLYLFRSQPWVATSYRAPRGASCGAMRRESHSLHLGC